MPDSVLEDLLRQLSPQVLGAVVRRYGHFDLAEDAVQEALVSASQQWASDGLPDNPRGWLVTVAARRLTDLLRADQARRQREEKVATWVLPETWLAPAADRRPADSDDTLILLFTCCHPSLTPASQIALTLRAVGGLTTAEIARAFMVPEDTMARRISRAKQRIKESGVGFGMPPAAERTKRLAAVLHVLYLVFNEGYASTTGTSLQRVELTAEAIRLVRLVHRILPDDHEVTGLLALMLLTDARRPARTGSNGELVPMADQDRSLWLRDRIAQGVELISSVLPHGSAGPYQLQAAIAAVHDEAASAEETDWPQIVALYGVLMRMNDNPMVALNHAVAVGMAHGPAAGLRHVERISTDGRICNDHRFFAVRAGLLEMNGDHESARADFLAAAERTTSLPQQRYLNLRAGRLDPSR